MGENQELKLIITRMLADDGYAKTVETVNKIIEEEVYDVSSFQHKNNSYPLPHADLQDLASLEKNCKWISKVITKTDLKHKERSYLMFIYMRYGEPGEKRLREILERQSNYKKKITDTQIAYYKKRGKFCGVSCQTLIKDNLCREVCENARA